MKQSTTRELWARQSLLMRWLRKLGRPSQRDSVKHAQWRNEIRDIGRELMRRTDTSPAARSRGVFLEAERRAERAHNNAIQVE